MVYIIVVSSPLSRVRILSRNNLAYRKESGPPKYRYSIVLKTLVAVPSLRVSRTMDMVLLYLGICDSS